MLTIKGDIYYIAVLNDVMDKECFEKWVDWATYYSEDSEYEDKAFNKIKGLLKL